MKTPFHLALNPFSLSFWTVAESGTLLPPPLLESHLILAPTTGNAGSVTLLRIILPSFSRFLFKEGGEQGDPDVMELFRRWEARDLARERAEDARVARNKILMQIDDRMHADFVSKRPGQCFLSSSNHRRHVGDGRQCTFVDFR